MKFNLMPPVEQERCRKENLRRRAIPLLLVLLILGVGLAAYGSALAVHAHQSEYYYEQNLQPVQAKIKEYNEWHRRLQTKSQQVAQVQQERIHWAPALVALADTRPETISVHALQSQKNAVTVTAQAADKKDIQAWQEGLRQSRIFRDVTMSQMKDSRDGGTSFKLHARLGQDAVQQTSPKR